MAAHAPAPRSDLHDSELTLPDAQRLPPIIIATAVAFGLVCGAFQITNTSIGWHITSGRWMAAHHEILDHDPFSFTSGGVEWIDHEWLFQLLVAALFDVGGAPVLVLLRMLAVVAMTLLLLRIGVSSGLDPPVALGLAALCVWAARPRFFVRPELATLVLLPLAVWLFAERRGRRWWPLPVAVITALGVNLHGAMLIAPVLMGVWYAGEIVGQIARRAPDRAALVSGATGLLAAGAATLANPFGLRIWSVPFRLAEMVRAPHIPNPEWLAPGPADAPTLYVALVLAALVLAAGSRAPKHWLLTAAAAALALRHIRNLGVFFVLLPIALAPALARLPLIGRPPVAGRSEQRVRLLVGAGLVAVLTVVCLVRPWPAAGFGFADRWYPDRAWRFMTDHDLLDGRLYNDVRFGGWLLLAGYPEHRVFLDDRNEVNEPLLAEIWRIFSQSDVAAWQAMLDGYAIDTVLLRYHEPLEVTTPDGADLGPRGFSQLWFPDERWAMVYWDDVAMILVRRSSVPGSFLAGREYRVLHPDDAAHVMARLAERPDLMPVATSELERALADDPECRRALHLGQVLGSMTRGP